MFVVEEQIDIELKAMDTCAYGFSTFCEVLSKIQKAVDDLSLHQYSNLPQWVAELDSHVSTANINCINIKFILK